MEILIIEIVTLAFIAFYFFWLFTGNKPHFLKSLSEDKEKPNILLFIIGSVLFIVVGYLIRKWAGYLNNLNEDVQYIATILVIILYMAFFFGLIQFLREHIIKPRVNVFFERIKKSPFGYGWKEYNAPLSGELYEWNKILLKYAKKDLYKLDIFSKLNKQILGVINLFSAFFALVFLLLIRLFYIPESYIKVLLSNKANSDSFIFQPFDISILCLFYLCMGLFAFFIFNFLLKVFKSFHKFYLMTPNAYYYGRALKAKNEGRVEKAIKYFKIVLPRASDGFTFPIKNYNGEIEMQRIGKEKIQKEIDSLKISK